MPARAHWRGFLKLSLVSCPIALYPAISAAERVSFRQVNRQTGNRLRQQMVDAVTGEVVQSHDKGRGYEIGERQFLLVEDEELEAAQEEARSRPYSTPPAVKPILAVAEAPAGSQTAPRRIPGRPAQAQEETRQAGPRSAEAAREEEPQLPPPPAPRIINNRTIEIERFIRLADVDPRYSDAPYYIAPRDEVGQEAFVVIRDALSAKGMAGMGRVILSKRERPILVRPMGKGLLGMVLRYAHEVRSEMEYFAGIPDLDLPDDMIEIAEHLIDTKAADFDPALLEDRYRTVLVSMLREKRPEVPSKVSSTAPSPKNVINLMDALKRSLEKERPDSSPKPSRRPPAKARSSRTRRSRKSD